MLLPMPLLRNPLPLLQLPLIPALHCAFSHALKPPLDHQHQAWDRDRRTRINLASLDCPRPQLL